MCVYKMNQLLLQVMADQFNNEQANLSEVVLGENEIICSLTNRVVKATDKELTLQSMINMMTENMTLPLLIWRETSKLSMKM